MIWQDFFSICFHPSPGVYIIHWKASSIPLDSNVFREKKNAERWLENNFRKILDESFEEVVWDK